MIIKKTISASAANKGKSHEFTNYTDYDLQFPNPSFYRLSEWVLKQRLFFFLVYLAVWISKILPAGILA
jgi:hypothetical protein